MNRIIFLSLFFAGISISIGYSQSWNEILKISASDSKIDGQFGYSVDIDNDIAVIGSNGGNEGRAYVFEKQSDGTWLETQILKASDGKNLDQFGGSVSINGDIIIIGASGADSDEGGTSLKDAGAVYIFQKSQGQWIEKQKLVASDPFSEDQFGISADVSQDYIFVGALWNDFDANGKKRRIDAGAVYVFEKSGNGNWEQKQKLTPKDRKPYDLFGVSVSVYKNEAIIGAYRNGFDANDKNYLEFAGAAYYYQKSSDGVWTETQKLTADKRSAGSFFGYSVSLAENTMIIGSQEHAFDVNSASELKGSGAAYIFNKKEQQWLEHQKITPNDRQKNTYFGESVDTDGKKVVVGAWGQRFDALGQNPMDTSGAVYIFEDTGNGNWVEVNKLVSAERKTGDQFGISVAVDGEYVMGGAWGHDVKKNNDTLPWSGSAFLFGNCEKPSVSISASNMMVIEGEDIILSASGAEFYNWDQGITNNTSFIPKKSGTYTVIGRNSDGCFAKATIDIIVKKPLIEEVTLKKQKQKRNSKRCQILILGSFNLKIIKRWLQALRK